MLNKPLEQKRNAIITEFFKLGFWGKTAFYNVCKSIDVALNGFELIAFYEGYKVNKPMVEKLEAIIDKLKTE